MISAIITAGGSSSRFEGNNKLLFLIGDKTVLQHTVDKFLNVSEIDEIVISVNEAIFEDVKTLFDNNSKIKFVLGGDNRQSSVFNALKVCSNPNYVLIHDGARPFITEDIILKTISEVKEKNACIVAVKTVDTIKIVDEMPDVPRGKAKWERNSCSNCGSLGLDHWEYCPLCGCEMESGKQWHR